MKKLTVTTGFVLLIAVLALAQEPATPPASGPSQSAQADAAYRLFPGDQVDIRFFFDPELNEQVQIRPDGKVSLQLIGEVQMSGKTVEEVISDLEQRYSKQLKNPEINLQIRSFAAQKVYVTGEVPKPGLVNMPGQLTVMDAIGEAGGIKTTGNMKTVVLIRKGSDNTPVRREIKLLDRGKPTVESAMLLRPFDVIMVPESKIRKVDRWVDQYLRQTNPANLAVGFQYIWQNTASTTIPF